MGVYDGRIDAVGAAIRLSGSLDPRLRARFDLARQRRGGDFSITVAEALVHRGDVVLDIGARWGTYAWFLARLVGKTGVVHAFEPNPAHAGVLRKVIGSRGRVYPVALSDETGDAQLHVPILDRRAADGLASLARPHGDHVTVAVERRRLDDVGLDRIDFVKCDVEGHELAVFRGGEETLRRLQPPVLVEVEQRHEGGDVDRTRDFFRALGYEGWAVHHDGLRPADDFDVERDQLAPLRRGGTDAWAMPADYVHEFLFVPAGADVARLRSR